MSTNTQIGLKHFKAAASLLMTTRPTVVEYPPSDSNVRRAAVHAELARIAYEYFPDQERPE